MGRYASRLRSKQPRWNVTVRNSLSKQFILMLIRKQREGVIAATMYWLKRRERESTISREKAGSSVNETDGLEEIKDGGLPMSDGCFWHWQRGGQGSLR